MLSKVLTYHVRVRPPDGGRALRKPDQVGGGTAELTDRERGAVGDDEVVLRTSGGRTRRGVRPHFDYDVIQSNGVIHVIDRVDCRADRARSGAGAGSMRRPFLREASRPQRPHGPSSGTRTCERHRGHPFSVHRTHGCNPSGARSPGSVTAGGGESPDATWRVPARVASSRVQRQLNRRSQQ